VLISTAERARQQTSKKRKKIVQPPKTEVSNRVNVTVQQQYLQMAVAPDNLGSDDNILSVGGTEKEEFRDAFKLFDKDDDG